MDNENAFEILVVEDVSNELDLLLMALKKNNLSEEVCLVKDGAEALEYIFCTGAYAHREMRVSPKVVLLDLKLPKVSGLEVLNRIKSDERTKAIPVVVLTSSQEEDDIVESYKLGANSYVVKPVDFQEFCRLVKEIINYWLLLNRTVA